MLCKERRLPVLREKPAEGFHSEPPGAQVARLLPVTPEGFAHVMGIEDEGLVEVIVEGVEDEDEWEGCPCCETLNLARLIAAYPRAAFWCVFCTDCGKFLQEKWNLLD
jgi:hypothetical protein